MHSMKTLIKNEIEKDKSLTTKLAYIGGFKNATPLYKFLNEPDREMDNLMSLVKIVEYLFDDRSTDILSEYFRRVNPNGKMARQVLEYSSFHGLAVRRELVEKMSECTNAESREWASLYVIYENIMNDPWGTIKTLNTVRVKSQEMMIFKYIMQSYCYYYLDNIHMVEIISESAENEIKFIKNEFIRNCFLVRLYRAKSVIYLNKNKISECREMADRIITLSDSRYGLAAIYQTKGISYLYEDYELGEELLKKAYDIYVEYPDKYNGDIHSSINLHRVFWGKDMFDMRIDGEVFDKHDAIMHFVRIGDVSKAKEILNGIDEDDLSIRDIAFQNYSKGIIYRENCYLYEAIKSFKKIGDNYYVRLPIFELRKQGYDNDLLDLLTY